MYSVKDILKSLNEFNYFIDEKVLSNLIKNWKIDPVYEDDDGVEYFDSLSIIKIKRGIKLKSQGFDNEQIIYHMAKILEEQETKEEPQETDEIEKVQIVDKIPAVAPVQQAAAQPADAKAFTIDITSQTLQLLADAVANKITNSIKSEIKSQIQNSDVIKELFLSVNKEPDAELKKDNEELSQQVEELLEDNRKMAQRIEKLENFEKGKMSFLNFLKRYIK